MRNIAIVALLAGVALPASAEMMERTSAHPVPVTVERLTEAAETAGATVFATVDHAAGAAEVGTELRPTVMVMFGNPALGTPAMEADQTAGLDLPLRVLVYEDSEGTVRLAWHDPADMAAAHGIPADAEVIAMMTGALDKLTGVAAGE